jgi:hypothetical protein
VKVPVVALNVAVVAGAATVTDAGTVNVVLVFVSVTVLPPTAATWFSVTVQLLAPIGPKVAGAQTSAATCTGASAIVTLCELPPSVAVMVAD